MNPKLLFYLILILGLYVIINLGRGNWEIYKKGDRLKEVQIQTIKLRKEIEQLEKRKQEVFSKEFIEKEIRDKLGLEYGGTTAGEKKE